MIYIYIPVPRFASYESMEGEVPRGHYRLYYHVPLPDSVSEERIQINKQIGSLRIKETRLHGKANEVVIDVEVLAKEKGVASKTVQSLGSLATTALNFAGIRLERVAIGIPIWIPLLIFILGFYVARRRG